MKTTLSIVLLLILILVCYYNIKETSVIEGEKVPQVNAKNNKDDEFRKDQQEQQLFPEVYNLSTLKIDKKLPLLKLTNLKDSLKTAEDKISFNVKLNNKINYADLYLFVNGIKRDMYYQIPGGDYKFKYVKLKEGENLVELFYRIGGKRSSSVYSVIKRE